MAHRRPCRKRSSSGPMNGASSANGAIVSARNCATWARASSVGIAKIVPARLTVSAASPQMLTKCRLHEAGQAALPGSLGPGERTGPLGTGTPAPPGDPRTADRAAAHDPQRPGRARAHAVGVRGNPSAPVDGLERLGRVDRTQRFGRLVGGAHPAASSCPGRA